jgi:Flp pilus assembly pilin Flp
LTDIQGGERMKRFLQDESGMGVVEVILIIVVLIGLVIIFQTQIEKIVNNIFKTITTKTGKVK